MQETSEKIKNGTLRIEKGRLIGLGLSGQESIDLGALDTLMGHITPRQLSDVLSDTVQQLGALGIHLYQAGESISDPTGALLASVPDGDALYAIHRVSKLFRA